MASEFALSDRWFSPVSTNTIDNRIATFTGGTTQGLTKDPGDQNHLSQLSINSIFEELDNAKVSWKIYYTVTDGYCLNDDNCQSGGNARYPASTFEELTYSYRYISGKNSSGGCTAPKQPSSVVGDSTTLFASTPTILRRSLSTTPTSPTERSPASPLSRQASASTTSVPWATPPTPPTPVTPQSLGYNPCTPTKMGP